jgi:hypothetical protein
LQPTFIWSKYWGQLIGSEKAGMLELIKNTYGAWATPRDVWIEKVLGMPDAELSDATITDLPRRIITILDKRNPKNSDLINVGNVQRGGLRRLFSWIASSAMSFLI